MPLKEINYNKTHFYKIVCKDTHIKDCYVGHTTDFTTRKSKHKKCCNCKDTKGHHIYLYEFMRKNGGWENWDMILIETISCENNLKARQIEREHIENLQASLNQHRSYRSEDEKKEQKREWIENNWEKNRESVYKSRKALEEKYPERYKEYKKKSSQKYRENHPEKFKVSMTCECGGNFRKHQLNRHVKSKMHQQYIQSLNQNNLQEPAIDQS